MKIKYRSNLTAGCIAIVAAVVLFLIIPAQVGVERKATFGINSRTLPYALSVLMAVCGAGLIMIFVRKYANINNMKNLRPASIEILAEV